MTSYRQRVAQGLLGFVFIAVAVVGATAQETSGNTSSAQAPAGQASGGKSKPSLVRVVKAEARDLTRTLQISGEVVATRSVVVAASKEGPIIACPWREGDHVRAGETLVEIAREIHQADVHAARAALAVALARLRDLRAGTRPEEIIKAEATVEKWQATLAEAQKNHDRQAQLAERDFTSRQHLDQASERLSVAQAEMTVAEQTLRMLRSGPTATELAVQEALVEEAAARVAVAEAHLAECVISAPFAALVTAVHVRAGDLAVPRVPLLEMYAPDSLVVRFSVPEHVSAGLHEGMRVDALLDAFPGQPIPGEVVRVYPLLEPAMRTRTGEAKLQTKAVLMPGQFARLTVQVDTARNAVVVPAGAVLPTPEDGGIVFVVEKNKAIRRKVEIGIEQDHMVRVTAGLSAGERVIVSGHEMLANGAAVRIAGEKESSEF